MLFLVNLFDSLFVFLEFGQIQALLKIQEINNLYLFLLQLYFKVSISPFSMLLTLSKYAKTKSSKAIWKARINPMYAWFQECCKDSRHKGKDHHMFMF